MRTPDPVGKRAHHHRALLPERRDRHSCNGARGDPSEDAGCDGAIRSRAHFVTEQLSRCQRESHFGDPREESSPIKLVFLDCGLRRAAQLITATGVSDRMPATIPTSRERIMRVSEC